jgi:uncharacterized protein
VVIPPVGASDAHLLADGVVALPGGFALLTSSRVLVCADAHLGYEDVMGGGSALPLWSTDETVAAIALVAQRQRVREIVFLGDAIHGAAMSAAAIHTVQSALATLRALASVTIIAGNHEGRTRGTAILGATVEYCERDGWTLMHGDRPAHGALRAIIGHLHPSLRLDGSASIPAFLGSRSLVVVPALTPYSSGLDVTSDDCIEALAPWHVERRHLHVVAATGERVYPFGTLSTLRGALALARPDPSSRKRRPVLRPDR